MKNADQVESLCSSIEQQRCFFELSAPDRQLAARVAALGITSVLNALSEELREAGLGSFAQTSALLDRAARQFSRDHVRGLIEEELGRFAVSPIYNVSAHVVDAEAFSGFVLYQDGTLRLSLVSLAPMAHRTKTANVIGNKPRGVTIQGMDSAMYFLAGGNASLRLWEAQPFERDEALDRRRIPPATHRCVADGDMLLMEGGRHGMSVDGLDAPMLFVMATCLIPRTPVNAHYVAETGELHSFTAAEMRASRIQLLATLLRELDVGASDAIEGLLHYPDHFVRWHLMRELLAAAPERACAQLTRMAQDDPHPQVREVAQKTLKMIERGELCPA